MPTRLVRWVVIAALVAPATLVAQQRPIRGTVTDAGNGQPVPGAVITVRLGGRGSAQARDDGHFTILVDPVPVTLLVRAVGYAPADVPVAVADSTVTVKLKSDPLLLDAVVVTGQAT